MSAPTGLQPSGGQPRKMSVAQAILVGQLVVNLPTLLLIFGAPLVGILAARSYWGVFGPALCILAWVVLLVGCAVAWIWWSFAVPRWRRWAIRRGVPPDELQRWAVITFLVWPKGWIFEKSEFKLKD